MTTPTATPDPRRIPQERLDSVPKGDDEGDVAISEAAFEPVDRPVTIPVTSPFLGPNERRYVLDCLDANWISSSGMYVDRFEADFARFCQARHAVSCSNGTAAVHLALLAAGIGPGDEVIVPTFTYVASVNPIRYVGATPVFVDSERASWNLDPAAVAGAITERTRAIVVVHLYGLPADIDPIMELAQAHGLIVIEDAAEAHGATVGGRPVGSIGDYGTFSFYGNKVITTGEGGMVVCNSSDADARLRQFRNQGQDPHRRYWFPEIGFNYRLTNIAAAIGVGQLERIEHMLALRRDVADWYREELDGIEGISVQPRPPWGEGISWLVSVLVDGPGSRHRDRVADALAHDGIETRPFFYPVHTLDPYRELAGGRAFPVAEDLGARGMNLPSSPTLRHDDVRRICRGIAASLRHTDA